MWVETEFALTPPCARAQILSEHSSTREMYIVEMRLCKTLL